MNNKIKTLGFLFLYPIYNLRYKYLDKSFPKVYDSIKTLQILIESRKSLSRFGDGEFNLICGTGIGFQQQNIELSQDLRRVLESNSENCYIGIPNIFNGLKRFNIEAKCFWLYSIVSKWNQWKKFIKNVDYLDTQCSRFYIDLKDKSESIEIVKLWKRLWNNRDVVIIEGEHTKMGIGNDLFDNCSSVRRIICPCKNAYSRYAEILQRSSELPQDTLILVALGPTASILSYDLAQLGYQAIDTGHLDLEYNWMKKQSRHKEAVPGRFVNEVKNNIVENIKDDCYESQVICRII